MAEVEKAQLTELERIHLPCLRGAIAFREKDYAVVDKNMREALAGADSPALVRSAHALRGASANLGATDLAWVCETLELNGTESESETAGRLWVGVRSVEVELELVRAAFAVPDGVA